MKSNSTHFLTSSLAMLALATAMPLASQSASRTSAAMHNQSEIEVGDAAMELSQIADAYLEAVTRASPFTVYFVLSDIKEPLHSAMPDNSPAALLRFNAEEDALYEALLGVDQTGLVARGDWVAYQSMKEMMEANIGVRQCRLEGWNVNHMDGWQTAFTDIAARQPVATEAERAAALERWAKLPVFIAQQEQNLKIGLANGYSAPKSVVRRVVGQLDAMLATPAEHHPLFTFAAEASAAPEFQASMRSLIEAAINPAIEAHRDFLRDRYLPAAREEIAISVLPGGLECYEAMLRNYHSAEIGAKRTYQRGLETVEARTAEAIARGKPLTGSNDLSSILSAINTLPANRFSSELELLEFTRLFIPLTREKMEPFFSALPMQEMVVEPYPDFLKGSGQSSRYEANPMGNGPAIYRIQTDDWGNETRGSAQITAVHEGYPGHHVQIATAFGLEGLHPVTRLASSTAFIEGWARYSEALAEEAGLYADGYGEITRRAWPARGMAIDAGVHAFEWTNEQAIAYAQESGRFVGDAGLDLLDRIAVMPGQLTAYDTGGLEIIALRAEAEARLGDRFDIRSFHDRVLENGAIPLGALRTHVEAWITERETKPLEGISASCAGRHRAGLRPTWPQGSHRDQRPACGDAAQAPQGDGALAEQDLVDTLNALEARSFAVWKAGDASLWGTFLSDKFVSWHGSGRIERSGAEQVLGGADCQISSYRLSGHQLSQLTPTAAVLTHRTEVDGTCGGVQVAPAAYTATIYVREGAQWKAVFRGQSAVVDPKKATKPLETEAWTGGMTSGDSFTQTLLAREHEVWSAWKDRDPERIDALLGDPIQFIDIFGNHLSTRPEAVAAWSGRGCDVKGFELSGAKAKMLTPELGILTVRAATDGQCFGQDVWPILATSIYVRHGHKWLWAFGINTLAG